MSKYLDKVQKVLAEMGSQVIITGNLLLVEKIEEEVVTKSGIVIAQSSNQVGTIAAEAPRLCKVIATGAGYFNEENDKSVPTDASPGDTILVGQASVKWLSVFPIEGYQPFTIGITSENEVQIRWAGEAAYKEFSTKLKG